MTKKIKLPKKYENIEIAIFEEVSNRGTSKMDCTRLFSLSKNYFCRYTHTSENYDKAMSHFTSQVLMAQVVEQMQYSASDRKYLMQKLRVFDNSIELPIPIMETAKDASINLSFCLAAYARKELSEDAMQAIRSTCEVYSKLAVATTLQIEVQELKELFEERFSDGNA